MGSSMLTNLELPSVVTVGLHIFETKPMLEADEIDRRVNEMGHDLAESYADRGELHVVTVMNGALHFASDLRRSIQAADPNLAITSDQIKVSSYTGTQSSGVFRLQSPPTAELKDKHVLIVEDIFDTGLTLKWLMKYFGDQEPASMEIAVAVNKDVPDRAADILGATIMHTGFHIPDAFVVGYGLDYEQRFRDLGGIHVLSEVEAAK